MMNSEGARRGIEAGRAASIEAIKNPSCGRGKPFNGFVGQIFL